MWLKNRRKPIVTIQMIIRHRLEKQMLARSLFDRPSDVVTWFGAVQAQDYLGALWAVGQRSRDAVESDVELALAERAIVRTWPMRGTLHFVAADDVRWLLELLNPRIIQRHALRLRREFELDDAALSRCRRILTKALRGGSPLTRSRLYDTLEYGGISPAGQRGIHILGRLAQEGLICFGPRQGKQHTFVLLDEWLPEGRGLLRDEALAELALRYFTSHGPATLRDLVWWSGLTVRDVQAGIHSVERRLQREEIGGESYWFSPAEGTSQRTNSLTHLLPPFDEYLVGYKNRAAVLEPRHAVRLYALLSPVMEIDGRIVGTWGRRLARGMVTVALAPFRHLSLAEKGAMARAVARYGKFLGVPATGSYSRPS